MSIDNIDNAIRTIDRTKERLLFFSNCLYEDFDQNDGKVVHSYLCDMAQELEETISLLRPKEALVTEPVPTDSSGA